MARDAGIPAQAMMQSYLIERLLHRLSLSPWRDNVIVKGGVLSSSHLGVHSRTTMDLDTTVRGFTLSHESVQQVFGEIAAIELDDDWSYEFIRSDDIRESDDYPGIRVHLKACYPPMAIPLTIDVTTGDRITPHPVTYSYPLVFDEGSIDLISYPLETVLAEKLETVVSRSVANTRPRDFYDIHMLWKLKHADIALETLSHALRATCEKRGSGVAISHWADTLREISSDTGMLSQWDKYARKNPYASEITLQECCLTAENVLARILG